MKVTVAFPASWLRVGGSFAYWDRDAGQVSGRIASIRAVGEHESEVEVEEWPDGEDVEA